MKSFALKHIQENHVLSIFHIYITLNKNHFVQPAMHFMYETPVKPRSSLRVLAGQRLEHPTGFTEVVGSIPTQISDNLLSNPFNRYQATISYLTHPRVHSTSFSLSYTQHPFPYLRKHPIGARRRGTIQYPA